MENEDLSKSQTYKKQFFTSQDKFFSKKEKFTYSEAKDTTKILSNIANKPRFSQIRQRYRVYKFLSKILLKSHLNWVLYAYSRNEILYIATQNHIGQNELNLQKLTILKYCKKSNDYNNITKVSIFRDENYIQKNDTEKIEDKYQYNFKEKSYGIFDENVNNEKHKLLISKIKNHILRLNNIK